MIWRDLKAPEVVEQVAQSEAHRRLIDDAGYNSAAVVALIARGRMLGALSFLHARKDLRYDPPTLSSSASWRIAPPLRSITHAFTGSVPRSPRTCSAGCGRRTRPRRGARISVVFEAAGEGIEIGGDLYDVLPTEDGCWILIGDVAGKGRAAAGVSVAVRHAVRGLTREVDEPVEVLERVNELLLEGTSLNDFATAMLIRMRRGDNGWSLALAAAGHPPAVHTTGGAHLLGGGSVLGALPDTSVQRHDAPLAGGDTLVLCTDGWLEAGPVEGHHPPEALAEMAHSLSGLELEELTERLRVDALARSEASLRDDMVILAVRPEVAYP